MSCAGVGWKRLSCLKTGNKGILDVKTVYNRHDNQMHHTGTLQTPSPLRDVG